MNKLTILIIGTVIIVGGISVVITRNSGDESVKVTNAINGNSDDMKLGSGAEISVDACAILNEAIAKTVLGDNAKKGDLPNSEVSTKDVSVSSCVYTAKINPSAPVRIANTKGVGLLVRAGKTNAGKKSNQDQFSTYKPSGVQDVVGLGDSAFFNPQFGQLNILKGGNWYIVTNYSGNAMGGTLDTNKTLANLLSLK